MRLRSAVRRLLALGLGAALLVVGVLGVGYPLWWNHRATTGGAALLAAADASVLTASSSCPTSPWSAAKPVNAPGILEVPSLGLVAPVLDGLGDNVLNVAVGHVTGAPWPGAPGEAMVEAHDVSYFAQLGHIRAGATVVWITRCERAEFKVLSTAVSAPGAVVHAPVNDAGLALVTCYPTNALWWTPKRFVVSTELVSSKVGPQTLPRLQGALKLNVPVPPALAAQGLSLSQNQLVLGVMLFSGSPKANWIEGPAPLDVEADALTVFFGAEKAARARNAGWWRAVAPGVAMPSSWPSFGPGAANITITVHGTTPTSITIASPSASATVVVDHNALHLGRIS